MTAADRMRWLDYRRDQRKATPGLIQFIRQDTGKCVSIRLLRVDPIVLLYSARRGAVSKTAHSSAFSRSYYAEMRRRSVGGRPLLVHSMRERTLGWDRMTNELRAGRAP